MSELFTKRALAKKRDRGETRKAVALLTPPLRSTLVVASVLVLGAIGWSIFARIPLKSSGYGVMVPSGRLLSESSSDQGRIVYTFNDGKLYEPRFAAPLFKFLKNPMRITEKDLLSLVNAIDKHAEEILDREKKIWSSANTKPNLTPPSSPIKTGQIMALIAPFTSIEKIELDTLRYLSIKSTGKASIKAQRKLLAANTSIFNAKSQILDKMIQLESKGYLSKNSVISYQSEVDEVVSKIQNSQLEIQKATNEIAKTRANLIGSLVTFGTKSVIFSLRDLVIVEALRSQYSYVESGDEVLVVTPTTIEKPSLIPVFFPNKDSVLVSEGMEALITPEGISRAQFGGIKGSVASMTRLPAASNQVESLVGVKAAGKLIIDKIKEPTPGTVLLKLDPSINDYVWSSGNRPPVVSLTGTVVNIDVTTDLVAPISLVIPQIKKFLGITPPQPKNPSTEKK